MIKVGQAVKVPIVIGNMVVGALTHCAFHYPKCDLKSTQMNVQCSLIQNSMLHVNCIITSQKQPKKNLLCTI